MLERIAKAIDRYRQAGTLAENMRKRTDGSPVINQPPAG
jgi:hypothetical protein